MKISFLPKTVAGRWSLGLAVAAVPIIYLGRLVVNAVLRSMGESYMRQWGGFRIPMACAAIVCAIALVTGLVSIIKRKELAITVLIGLLGSLGVVAFVLGEVILPN